MKVTIEGKNIGYELRCAPPIPLDVEYTRDLGYGAVEYLKELMATGDDEIGAMITVQEGRVVPLEFGSFSDPETGKVRLREVDMASTSYRVAREYMIRLDRADLEDAARLKAIAEAAGMAPEEFRDRYGHLVGD
jgi:6-phosphofructokinase 1